MSHTAAPHCAWRTAVYGDNVSLSTRDIQSLGEHLSACQNPPSHLFALRCAAETTHGFVASRFVTTLAIFALVLLLGYWLV